MRAFFLQVCLMGCALSAQTLPDLYIKPANPILSEGYDLKLTAASPSPMFEETCQWFRNGSAIPGATTRSYSVHGALISDGGTYTCSITNGAQIWEASTYVKVRAWDRSLATWPNAVSSRNSDSWIMKFHDRIELMQPRVVYINFGNGVSDHHATNDDNILRGAVDGAMLACRVQAYVHTWEVSTTYQPVFHPKAKPFISPVVTLVDLHDTSDHANALVTPRRCVNGTLEFDYTALFSEAFTPLLGLKDAYGTPISLSRAFELGLVNDAVVLMNGVVASPGTPADQCIRAYETESVFPCYNTQFQPTGVTVSWPSVCDLPWNGTSMRVVLVNMSRDLAYGTEGEALYGYEQHAMGHELESRAYDADFVPYFSTYFRRYADLDMSAKYGIAWNHLYAGGNAYTYADPNEAGAMTTLVASKANPATTIYNYRPVAGNVHYPPGASRGYDYHPKATVMASMETFQKRGSVAVPFNESKWAYLNGDHLIFEDNGGKWMAYWFQNMPGYLNESLDDEGKPMKNWWVFLYY